MDALNLGLQSLLGPYAPLIALAAGFALRHWGPKLAGHPLLAGILTLLNRKPSPNSSVPATPAVPAIPADHPMLKEILDRLRNKPTIPFLLACASMLFFGLTAMADQPTIAHDPVTSTVRVLCLDARGQVHASGSGVVVESGCGTSLVVTCRHVLSAGHRYAVVSNGQQHQATAIGADAAADLAGLEVDAELPAAPLAKESPEKGRPLTLYGFPGSQDGKIATKKGTAWETVMASLEGRPFCPQLHVNFLSESGDSGGGVFDTSGSLCGLNWGHNGKRSECVCLEDLKRFIRDRSTRWRCPGPCGENCRCVDPKGCREGRCTTDPRTPPLPASAAVEPRNFAAAYDAVMSGRRVVLYVGQPAAAGAYHADSLRGFAPGVYDCFLQNGRPKMTPRTIEIQLPPACSTCPNGACRVR